MKCVTKQASSNGPRSNGAAINSALKSVEMKDQTSVGISRSGGEELDALVETVVRCHWLRSPPPA